MSDLWNQSIFTTSSANPLAWKNTPVDSSYQDGLERLQKLRVSPG